MKATRLEIETKFMLPASRLAQVEQSLRSLCQQVARPQRVQLHDSYYDTADWWFLRAGLACRIRRCRGPGRARPRAWLMLKELASSSGGVAMRFELEDELTRVSPDQVDRLPGRLGRRLNRLITAQRSLVPLFDLHNTRTTWIVQYDSLRAEVSADVVRFAAAGRSATQTEVEIEALDSEGVLLTDLADRLRLLLDGRHATESKFATGLSLAQLRVPTAPPEPSIAHAAAPADASARQIIADLLARFDWYEPGTQMGLNPEFVHQLRLTTRALRAALRTFSVVPGTEQADALAAGLRPLGQALGRVRDLDVQLRDLDAHAAALAGTEPDAVQAYRRHLISRSDRAKKQMLVELAAPATRATLARLWRLALGQSPAIGGWAMAGVLAEQGALANPASTPVGRFAAEYLARRVEQLLATGGQKVRGTDRQRHRLRLRIKRVQSLAQWTLPLYGRPMKRLVRRLIAVRQALGRMQDTAVAIDAVRSFTRRGNSQARRELEGLLDWHRTAQQLQGQQLRRQWRKLARKGIRRRVLAALSDHAE